jgi:hypothetical protein
MWKTQSWSGIVVSIVSCLWRASSRSPESASRSSAVFKTRMMRVCDGAGKHSSLAASIRRETVMKEFFLAHYRVAGSKPKVMAVFGQNHLHRGIDRRGVSTLGNFIAELAIAEGVQSFHVVLFAAGGKINFFGLQDIDQRKDDPAFAVFASAARYPATVFDLRPIRRALHRIASEKLSASDSRLLYWADSYDAVVCYRQVTPADH